MGKRRTDFQVSPKKKGRNVPRVSAMDRFYEGGSGSSQQAAGDAKLVVAVLPHCTIGSVYNPAFGEEALDVVIMESVKLYPNPTYMLKKVMKEFIYDDSGMDRNSEEVVVDDYLWSRGASFVYVDKKNKDQDNIGYNSKRSGFYVRRSSLKDLIMLLDELMKFRLTFYGEGLEPLDALPHMHVYIPELFGVKIDADEDEMHCPLTLLEEVPDDFSVFNLPPPVFPPRNMTLDIDMVSSEEIHLIFGGNTKPFQEGFVLQRIKLSKTGEEFFRVLKNLSLKNMETATKFMKEIYINTLKQVPIVIRLMEGDSTASFPMGSLKTFLKCLEGFENVRIDM